MSLSNKKLIKKFIDSMQLVAAELEKQPNDLTRDSYIKTAIACDYPRLNKVGLNLLGGFTNAKNLYFPKQEDITNKTASAIIRSHKERLDKKYATDAFYETELESLLHDILSKTMSKMKLHKKVNIKSRKKTKRTLIGHLSDMHYGCNIDPAEVGGVNKFNWEIAARRTAMFMEQLATYKPEHREDTDLVLLLNGDILAGVIHNQEWFVDLMTTQFAGALHILTQAITFAAQRFQRVRVYTQPGNHGRMQHKADKGRANTHKWDNFETMLFIALKTVLRDYKNVEVIIEESPYTVFDVQGHKVCITHGDTVFSPGNPGNSIKMKDLKNQVNSLNASLSGSDKVSMVFLGHVHTPTIQKLDNETYIIINGCLSGIDPFAQSIGIFKSHATQQIIEVTPQHPVGDMRFVQVDLGDDRKDLEKIIEPFKGKF